MNTTVKKGPEVSKSNADSLALIITNALVTMSRHEAHQSKHGRWFIIHLDNDDVVDTLHVSWTFTTMILLFCLKNLACSMPFLRRRHCVSVLVKAGGQERCLWGKNQIWCQRILFLRRKYSECGDGDGGSGNRIRSGGSAGNTLAPCNITQHNVMEVVMVSAAAIAPAMKWALPATDL